MTITVPAEVRRRFQELAAEVTQRLHGATGCVIATVDGRMVASQFADDTDGSRVAAMIGSMVALGEAVGRELRIGRSQYVVVNAHDGILLLCRVPAKRALLVVGVLARSSANVGMILHEAQRTARSVGQTLDQWLDDS